MPSDFGFAEFMERAVDQGIVIGSRAQTLLRATDLLRKCLASPHMLESELQDGDPSRKLMKLEIQVLVISLIRVLRRLLTEQAESTHADLSDEAHQEKVLVELDHELHEIAKSFGLLPEELISLDLSPLGRFKLIPGKF